MMVVKPQWAFMIPIQEFATFYPTTDYIVVPGWDTKAMSYMYDVKIDKPRIMVVSNASGQQTNVTFEDQIKSDIIILSDNIETPTANLQVQALICRFMPMQAPSRTLVGIWHGEKNHFKSLKLLTDTIALPRTENRITLKPDPGCWFLGYKNYDEVLRLKPSVVVTGSPFTAAKRGDLLQTRVRRPKALAELDFHMVLSKREAEIAYQNIKFLKTLSWEA